MRSLGKTLLAFALLHSVFQGQICLLLQVFLDFLLLHSAAAAAKSLQLCPTLWDPRDSSPPGSPVSGILQARTLEWVAVAFSDFCILVPYNEKDIFFWVLILEGLVGLHRTIQLQLIQCYWLGHRLGLPWYWMVCLGNEQRSFCRFWDCIQVLHFGLFCWPWWLLHFF